MKIFLAGASFHSHYGGPAYSVSRLAQALGEAGLEVGLWAPDGSAVSGVPVPDHDSVRRLKGSLSDALQQFGNPDLVHDNGIWMPHNHRLAVFAARSNLPRVVSTRGMLEPWALRHKRLKKWFAWRLYQARDLRSATLHHATSEAEAVGVRRQALGVQVQVIPNGVDLPKLREEAARPGDGRKIALFLGRIYPVKGLPMLIEAWARVRPAGWDLRIAGPDEAGHRAQVERAVRDAGLSAEISFVGPLVAEAKEAELQRAQLFILPSYSESFGLAVGEALAHALPVLTTTAVPWPMLGSRDCGWQVEATVDGLSKGLAVATAIDDARLREMGAKGRELIAAEFGWLRVAKQFGGLYEDLVTGQKSDLATGIS